MKSNIIPNPWMLPEIVDFMCEFLTQNLNANVLEFGSGCSTAFFAQYTNNLVTVENNPKWHGVVQKYIDQNNLKVDLRLVQNNYYEECEKFPKNYFDLILIDGHHRMNCLRYAKDILKSGGVLVLDDSTYFEKFKEADTIMNDWKQRFDAKGFKKNPVDPNLPEREGTVTWWIKP